MTVSHQRDMIKSCGKLKSQSVIVGPKYRAENFIQDEYTFFHLITFVYQVYVITYALVENGQFYT